MRLKTVSRPRQRPHPWLVDTWICFLRRPMHLSVTDRHFLCPVWHDPPCLLAGDVMLPCTGGQRDWKQVICNGGVATELAVIYMINAGCGEYTVDFRQHSSSSWLVAAILGALSCSCGDTFASEIGSAVGSWSPRLITDLRPVPKGAHISTCVYRQCWAS